MKVKEYKTMVIVEVEEFGIGGIEVVLSEEDYKAIKDHNEVNTLIEHIGQCNVNQMSGTLGIVTNALTKEEYANYEDDNFIEGESEIEIVVDWKIKEKVCSLGL